MPGIVYKYNRFSVDGSYCKILATTIIRYCFCCLTVYLEIKIRQHIATSVYFKAVI